MFLNEYVRVCAKASDNDDSMIDTVFVKHFVAYQI